MLRAMRYWSGLGPQVHVMDGSKVPLSEVELAGIQGNVHYHHHALGFHDRLKCSIPHIQTEFCALISDDEFYLPSGVFAAISYLDASPGAVACCGRVVRFWNFAGEIFWREDYKGFIGYSVQSTDAERRMIDHMERYTPSTIYGVARTDAWKNAISLLTHKEYAAFALGELQFELAMAFQGTSRVLEEPFWLRSAENDGVRGTDISLMPERRFETWWDSADKVSERQEMLTSMAEHFVAWKGGDKANTEQAIKRAFNAYRHRPVSPPAKAFILLRVFRALKWRASRVLFSRTYKPGGVWYRLDALIGYFEPAMPESAKKSLREVRTLLMHFHYGGSA